MSSSKKKSTSISSSTMSDKENQVSSSSKQQQKKASLKKGNNDNDTAVATSPYERRWKVFNDAVKAVGDDAILYLLSDEDELLERTPGILPENISAESLSKEERKVATAKLTEANVAKLWAMIVPRAAVKLYREYRDDILYADNRWNQRGSSMIYLSTYSSCCMYPVLSQQLTAATREVNKAERLVLSSSPGGRTPVPGVAKKALEVTMAVVLAFDAVDHWRVDTEEPEQVDKLAKRLVKVLKTLLWFTDAELGCWDDGNGISRTSWLAWYQRDIATNWKETADGLDYKLSSMNVRVAKNGKGMGRITAATTGTTAAAVAANTSGKQTGKDADKNPAPTKKRKASS